MQLRHMIESAPQRVFVYGTLKTGFGNWSAFLSKEKCLGLAKIRGIMFHIGGFPAISLADDFGDIHGEVYEVDWNKVLVLDGLEGIDHGHYQRVEVKLPEPYRKAWTYVYASKRAGACQYVIPSGTWQGQHTPKAKWLGWGKGIEIGAFEAKDDTIVVKSGNGVILKQNIVEGTYEAVHVETGQLLGSYKHIRDMLSGDGKVRPVLRLNPVLTAPDNPGEIPKLPIPHGAQPGYLPPPRPHAPICMCDTCKARRVEAAFDRMARTPPLIEAPVEPVEPAITRYLGIEVSAL